MSQSAPSMIDWLGPLDCFGLSRLMSVVFEALRCRFGGALTWMCLPVLLLGCTQVKPVALVPRDVATSFRTRSLDDPGLREAATGPAGGLSAWPPGRLDARALDVAALYFSPSFQVARSKWQVARAAIVTADELPNPTLNLAPQYVANAIAGVPAWVVASSLVQVIDTAGKHDFRVERARYLAEAARFDMLNTAWETIGAVNGALLDAILSQRRIAALDRLVQAQSALVSIAERRVQGGVGSRLEIMTAQTTLNRAILDREAARGTLLEAHHRLAQAVGIPADAIHVEQLSALQPEKPTAEAIHDAQSAAVLNRADLLGRLADYAASDVALQLEVARQYPDLELGPAYEYDQGSNKWGLSIGLQLPLFNQNQGAIGEAVAQRQQAADEFVVAQARVMGEIDQALAAYESAGRVLATADDLTQREAAQLRAQQTLFDRGETDQLDLLAARAEFATVELARIDAEGALRKAALAFELASQHSHDGFDPSLLIARK